MDRNAVFHCRCFDLALANTVQLSSVSDTLLVHGIPKLATVIVITIFVATVVYGGLKRIVYVTERMIPFMSILYMAFGLIIILMHVEALPGIILAIFKMHLQALPQREDLLERLWPLRFVGGLRVEFILMILGMD